MKVILGDTYFEVAKKIPKKLEDDYLDFSEKERALIGTRKNLEELGKHIETVKSLLGSFRTVMVSCSFSIKDTTDKSTSSIFNKT